MKNYKTNEIISNFKDSKSKRKAQEGITLVALIITIIVLLILAVVTIASITGNGIINHAENARDKYRKAQEDENSILKNYEDFLDIELAKTKNNETVEPVTNPYSERSDWMMGWIYQNDNWVGPVTPQSIVDTYELNDVSEIEGLFQNQIAEAKRNNTNLVIVRAYPTSQITGTLIIEGNGLMGDIIDENFSGLVWQALNSDYKNSITEVMICDRITSICEYAFSQFYGINNVKISNSVTSIGEGAFIACTNLKSITIPTSVTSISKSAFKECTNLTSITIPSSVTRIDDSAFYECTSLSKVKILQTDENNFYVGNSFYSLSDNSKIYVLNEGIKNKLSGKYYSSITTVEVVTEEEMNLL